MNAGHANARLFGTDGIRQTMGNYPLDRDSIFRLGHALGQFTRGSGIVIGRDTRESGREIEALLRAGINRSSQIFSLGVIPTPGLSFITRSGPFQYGIMITASHNPYTDNGIKLFGKNGEKLPPEAERQIESLFFQSRELEAPSVTELPPCPENGGSRPGASHRHAASMYRQFLMERKPPLDGLRIVLDCANGATSGIAPNVFGAACPDVIVTHALPDGRNINLDCGSTYLGGLKDAVKAHHADLGIAFDGDGDRVLMVDSQGRELDGDHVLYIMARYFMDTAQKFQPVVVGTVMSNLGLENRLRDMGVRFVRADVGDKNVYMEMKKENSSLGGEPSGHTILRDFQPTGDGIHTALCFVQALKHLDIQPSRVFDLLPLYPQIIKNVKIKEKPDLDNWNELRELIDEFNKQHRDTSRLLIRYSGTEPKIRIMMESKEPAVIDSNIETFVRFFESTIGL